MSYKGFISYSHAADGKLAPSLQSALHRFANPWYRLRAMRMFRDKTSLSVTPALWPSIERALGESEYFLLMASPEAAGSEWVSREINWWLRNRSVEQFLIVLTDGELCWDEATRDFDWERTTALPTDLAGRFMDQPLYVDLRWAKRDEGLSLRHTQFRSAVLDIASTLHGKAKDELDGEDVRQHRRVRVIATGAVGFIFAFAIIAAWQGLIATKQRDTALISQSRFLADLSKQRVRAGNIEQGVLLALEALPKDMDKPKRPYVPEAEAALNAAMRYPTRLVQIATLSHYKDITHAAFSPDGKRLVTAAADSMAKFWDANTGAEIVTLKGHKDMLTYATFSPDGTRLVTSSEDGTARVWDAKNGEQILVLKGHLGSVRHVEFSADGDQIVTGSADATARVWNANTGKYIRELKVGDAVRGVEYVAFSPDGGQIVTAAIPTILWDAKSGQRLKTIQHGNLTSSKFGLKLAPFSPSGALFATPEGNNVRVWNTDDRNPIVVPRVLEGHKGEINFVGFSPHGHRIISGSADGTARIWDIGRGEETLVMRMESDSQIRSAILSLDGRWVATTGSEGVHIWDVNAGHSLLEIGNKTDYTKGAIFSPDSRHLITVYDNKAELFEIQGSPLIARLSDKEKIRTFALSAQSDRILTAADSGHARLWRLSDGSPIGSLEGHNEAIQHATFSPDGHRIATASKDDTVRVWDSSGNLRNVLRGHQRDVFRAMFSKDGQHIATVSRDGTARIWDESGSEIAKSVDLKGAFLDAVLAPDGLKLLNRIDEEVAQLRDENGVVGTLQGITDEPIDGAFSPDGKYVVTYSSENSSRSNADSKALLWDAGTGHRIASLGGHANQSVTLARFNANGDSVITGSTGTLRVWSVPDGMLQSTLGFLCPFGGIKLIDSSADLGRVIVLIQYGEILSALGRRCLVHHRIQGIVGPRYSGTDVLVRKCGKIR